MEGNCEACAWIDRAQSGAISRDLAQVPRSPLPERRRKAEAEAEASRFEMPRRLQASSSL
jgi:hypothetical protein